jgi:LytS/YehU family sensor histidine kinase
VAGVGHWRDSPPSPDSTDTGLDNVRTRLQTQYPDQHDFALLENDGWVRARIEIDTDALDDHE